MAVQKDSTDLCIQDYPASMYNNTTKKWVDGTFYVSPEGIYFECTDKINSPDFHGISIDYEEISLVMKEASSYVFPSVTALVGSTKYWFSSFENRDSVFVLIEHFYKERLLPTSNVSANPSNTRLGQELLALAHESSRTLNSAARTLHRQGKQLDDALLTAENINDDLAVADTMLSRLESWFGGVFQPSKTDTRSLKACNQTDSEQRFRDITMVFQKYYGTSKSKSQHGLLRLGKDAIVIANAKGNVVNQFLKHDITKLVILTPWELKIHQEKIGQKSLGFIITAAQLVLVEPLLRRYYRDKLEFDNNQQRPVRPQGGSKKELTCKTLSFHTLDNEIITTRSENAVVTEEEAKELYQMITAMKSLAVDVGREQTHQLDKIDRITSSVDSADIHIREDIKRIKRLM